MLLLLMRVNLVISIARVSVVDGRHSSSAKIAFTVHTARRRGPTVRGSPIRRSSSSVRRLNTTRRRDDVQVSSSGRVIGSNVVRVLLRTDAHAR